MFHCRNVLRRLRPQPIEEIAIELLCPTAIGGFTHRFQIRPPRQHDLRCTGLNISSPAEPEAVAQSTELCRPAIRATTRPVMKDITGPRRFSETDLIAAILNRFVEFFHTWLLAPVT